MMKAKMGGAIILGLSDENMRRLKEGQPIKFNLNELGMQDCDLIIFNGKTEQSMYEMFKDKINPLTTIIKDSNSQNN